MKKFYSKEGSDVADESAVKEMLEDLKTLIMTQVKEPTIRALMCFLMLTGARVKEVIPNSRYKTAVLFSHLTPNSKGIFTLPLTEKKRLSKITKYNIQTRFAIIYDMDLWNVVYDYVFNVRKFGLGWESEVLRKTWFNPVNFKKFLFKKLTHKKETGIWKAKSKFYKEYAWVFMKNSNVKKYGVNTIIKRIKTTREKSWEALSKDWLIHKILFPLPYKTIYNKYLSQIKFKANLIDLRKGGEINIGERGLYSHIGREYFVNYWLRNFNVSEYEVARVLNWSRVDNVKYYVRKDIALISRIALKVSASTLITEEERKQVNEVAEDLKEKVKEIEEKYQSRGEEVFSKR